MPDETKKQKFSIVAKPTTVACPQAGELPVLSFITWGAMTAYRTGGADAKSSFLGMLEKLRLSEKPPSNSLTDADIDAIAKFYLSPRELDNAYNEARKTADPFEAFEVAIKGSSIWEQSERDTIRITTQLSPNLLSSIQETNRSLAEIAAAACRPSIQIGRTLADVALEYQRTMQPVYEVARMLSASQARFSLQAATLQNVFARADSLRSITESITKSMAGIEGLAQSLKLSHRFIYERYAPFAAAVRSANAIADIAARFRPLEIEWAELHRATHTQARDITLAYPTANAIVSNSDEAIAAANGFFSRGGSLRALISDPLPAAVSSAEGQKLKAAENKVVSVAQETGQIVHAGASDIFLFSNDVASIVAASVSSTIDERLKPYIPLLNRMAALSDPPRFIDLLHRFATALGKDYWKVYWEKPGDSFVAKPEALAQSHLGMYLDRDVGPIGFVGPEIGSGNGFIDLLVNLLGYNHILEVKIVGASWGIGHAKAGLPQIDGYMKTHNAAESYLLVLDGRKTTKGEQLESHYDLPNGRVHVVVARIYHA